MAGPPSLRTVVAGLLTATMIVAAIAVGAIWWAATDRAERSARDALADARARRASFRALVREGEGRHRGSWYELASLAVIAASPDEGTRLLRERLEELGARAGVQPLDIDVAPLADPAASEAGCMLEARCRVGGSCASLVNWFHVLGRSRTPALWIREAVWESDGGDPPRLVGEAVLHVACLPPGEG